MHCITLFLKTPEYANEECIKREQEVHEIKPYKII